MNSKLYYLFIWMFVFTACNKEQQEKEGFVLDKPAKVANINFEIEDENNDQREVVGEELTFVPKGQVWSSDKFVWHFGNGDSCHTRNCKYTYREKGTYRVSLLVNGKHAKDKLVFINETYVPTPIDTIIEIHGPAEAFVNEKVVFRAHGLGVEEWYWEFGESVGIPIRVRQAQMIHEYQKPGKYTVKVATNLSEYPVSHRINILPKFEVIPADTTKPVDSLKLVGDKIKWYFQQIANSNVSDSRTIKKYRNLIKDEYICNLGKLVIVINGSRYNDLYSYCQGIHHLDSEEKQSISIDEVKVDTIRCIEKIEVTQSNPES